MLKMRALITMLVLLLSMGGSQTRSTQTEVHTESQSTGAAAAAAVTTQLDVSAELSELRNMVEKQGITLVEMRMTLSFTQDELQNTKDLLNKIDAENDAQDTAVKQRLMASETKVEALERVSLAQEAEMTAVKTRLAAQTADLRSVTERLAATETDMENVKKDTAAQHTDLTTMKAEVMNLSKEHAAQDTQMATVKNRLAVTETKVGALERVNSDQEAEMTTMKTELMNLKIRMDTGEAQVETRLSSSETEVDKLKMEHAAQEAELTAVKSRLAATETEVVNLEKENTEKPKVAFSAGLTNSGYLEAGNTDLNLVFTKIITNVGRAYSNITGFFTAPVKGVYYFRFTVVDILSSHSMKIRIVKNGEEVMFLSDYDTNDRNSYLSSGVTLQLEVGDVVNMQLPAGKRLFDNSDNYCTFSGFLLFPL